MLGYMITGSRSITNKWYIDTVLSCYDVTLLNQGGARGVDTIAKEYCETNQIETKLFEADWDKHGKKAGFIRNIEMIDKSHTVIAIWDGHSKGTRHAITEARKRGLTTHVHFAMTTTISHFDDKKAINIETLDLPIRKGMNRYEAFVNLSKEYNPLKFDMSMFNDKTITGDRELLKALERFLVNKVLLQTKYDEVEQPYIPINNSIQKIGNRLGLTELFSYVVAKRLHPFEFHTLEEINKPTEQTIQLMLQPDSKIDAGVEVLKEKYLVEDKTVRIVLLTDSDADGVDSAALGERYFNNYSKKNKSVVVYVNERRYGNGVNAYLTDLTTKDYFDNPVDNYIIITADHGTANEKFFKELKQLGKNVSIIVTDHHLLPSTGGPVSVDAFVNPQDPDSSLPPYISGCVVLYALLLRFHLKYVGKRIGELDFLMPYNAITTISDMMDTSKPLNRYFFKQGMKVMKKSKFGAWQVFRSLQPTDIYLTDSMSRGWNPLLNSCNRMGVAWLAKKLLTSSNVIKSDEILREVNKVNNSRKRLQKSLTKEIPDGINGRYSVAHNLDLKNLTPKQLQHAGGVIGIVANNIGDVYSMPCFIFVKQGNELKGSGRAIITNIHIERCINYVKEKLPQLNVRGGGHRGAGGFTIDIVGTEEETMKLVKDALDEAVYLQTNGVLLMTDPIDMPIELAHMNMNLIELIEEMSPFGLGFKPIKFIVKGLITGYRDINKTMCVFKIIDGNTGHRISAISFQSSKLGEIEDGKVMKIVAELNIDNLTGLPILYV